MEQAMILDVATWKIVYCIQKWYVFGHECTVYSFPLKEAVGPIYRYKQRIIHVAGYQNNLKVLYSAAKTPGSCKKSSRHIPQAPERILDAPEILDDYCECWS